MLHFEPVFAPGIFGMSTAEFVLILALFAFLFGFQRTWRLVKKLGSRVETRIAGLYKELRALQREISKNL